MATMTREKPREKKKKSQQRRSLSPVIADQPTLSPSPGPSSQNLQGLLPNALVASTSTSPSAVTLPSTAYPSVQSPSISSTCDIEDFPGTSAEGIANIEVTEEISTASDNELIVNNNNAPECIPTNNDEAEPEPSAPDLSCIENHSVPSTDNAPPTLAQGLNILEQRSATIGAYNDNAVPSTSSASCYNEQQSIKKTNTKVSQALRLQPKEGSMYFSDLKHAQERFGITKMQNEQLCVKVYYESESYIKNECSKYFLDLLADYCDAVKIADRKRREMSVTESENSEERSKLWSTVRHTQVFRGRCADGRSLELQVAYGKAMFLKDKLPRLRMKCNESLNDMMTGLCVFWHRSAVAKLKVDDVIHSELNDSTELRNTLALLLTHLNRADASIGELHTNIAQWAYYIAHRLITKSSDDYTTITLLINQLVRQTRSISWALPLVQIEVQSVEDCNKMLVALSSILENTRVDPVDTADTHQDSVSMLTCKRPSTSMEGDDWTVLEREGEMVSERDVTCTLSESDLLGLLRQMPVADTLHSLMMLRNDLMSGKLTFQGDPSHGAGVLKTMLGAWSLLEIARRGTHTNRYRDVTHWLCRLVYLTLHCVADLHEATVGDVSQSAEVREEILFGLDQMFRTGLAALQQCAHRDMALTYASHLPFQMISDKLAREIFDSVTNTIKLENTVECYHAMACLQYLAICRKYDTLTEDVAEYLYKVGFCEECSRDDSGAWARSLLAGLMRQHTCMYTYTLLRLATTAISHQPPGSSPALNAEWVQQLELRHWRPTVHEVQSVLAEWTSVDGLRMLCANIHVDAARAVQNELALLVVQHARRLSTNTVPEWMYQALTNMRLHSVDWQGDLNAAPSITECAIPDFNPESENVLTCMWAVLTTSWGHSVPLICEHGVKLMIQMVAAERVREAVHCLAFVMVVMLQSPESIGYTAGFKELLMSILNTGQSYTALMSRLVGKQKDSGVELLETVMKTHLLYTYKQLYHSSPRVLLQCWLQLLTSPYNWTTTSGILHLLNVAIESSHMFIEVVNALTNHLIEQLQKRPSKSARTWLTGSTFCGLVRVSKPPLPFLWLRTLHADHLQQEVKPGIWYAMLWELHKQRNISIDKALEKCGGPQSAEGMVIYRLGLAIQLTPLTHPVLVHLWKYFFKLYLDRPMDIEASEFAAVGPLFFRGASKSRMLGNIAKRLNETIEHHQGCLKEAQILLDSLQAGHSGEDGQASPAGARSEVCPSDHMEDVERMMSHHQLVLKQLKNYLKVIQEPSAAINLHIPMLATAVQFAEGPGFAERKMQVPAGAAPPLAAPWHVDVSDTLLQLPPVDRMTLRFKGYPPPLGIKQPELKLAALLPSNLRLDIVPTLQECLKDIGTHERQFSFESGNMKTLYARIFELIPHLYKPQLFKRSSPVKCGNQCTGPATITATGEEWLKQPGVEREIEDAERFRTAKLHNLLSPNEKLARLCIKLQLLIRRGQQEGLGALVFDAIMKYAQAQPIQCPPITDTIHTLVEDLAEKHISKDVNRCLSLLRRKSEDSWAALPRAVLRPAELPPSDFPVLYLGLLRQSWTEPHVIFSHLSKFDVKNWKDKVADSLHSGFMEDIFVEMAVRAGTEPKGERLMLVELLSKHMTELVSPYSLRKLVEVVTRSAVAGTLPVCVWPHVIRAANQHAANISDADQLTEHVRAIVEMWWRARFTTMPVCALGERAPHALYAAELAHAYLLATLAVGKNTYSPAECANRATTQIMTWWTVWLRPWWDAEREQTPLLPWSETDDVISTRLLQHFVEDVKLTLDTCAGEGAEVLRHVYRWGCDATWRPVGCSSEPVLRYASSLLRALRALPWDQHNWFRSDIIPVIDEMLLRDEECRKFTTHTLKGNTTWLPADTDPRQLSTVLKAVLRLLTDLDFPLETVERAISNLGEKFEHLEAADLDAVLDMCFLKNHSVEKPIHTRPCFQLICAAATLTKSFSTLRRSSPSWNASEAKRLSLLARWIRTLGETLAASQTPEAKKMVADGTELILKAIQESCVNARSTKNVGEGRECVECCRILLETAAGTLCTQELAAIALPVWVTWAETAMAPMVQAALRIMTNVTSHECFYRLSDALMQRHLTQEGTWNEALEGWTNTCGMQVEVQLRSRYLHTSYATIQLQTKSAPEESIRYAKIILTELDGVKITASTQELPTLTLLYFVFRTLPLPPEKPDAKDRPAKKKRNSIDNTALDCGASDPGATDRQGEVAAEDVELWDKMQPMLASWMEAGRSRLMKKLFSSPYEASQNFQVMCKYSACAVTAVRERYGRASQADIDLFNKMYEDLGNISRDKAHSALGHAVATCRGWLRVRSTLADLRSLNYYQLYALLYPERTAYLGDPPD